jgi:glyoxylase-like metal-dependent hydrolase (beta-lactamase superfamily II)
LKGAAISPPDIDTIIITHGDIDHIGGLATQDQQLIFPNARYILLKEAWDFWSNEALVAKWPPFLTVFGRTVFPLIRERIQVVESGEEFLPGFELFSAPGHRPGHSIIKATSAGQVLLHIADSVGHPLLMKHPYWPWYADARDEQAAKDKAQVLNQAATEKALVFGSHLPFPGVGRVEPFGDGWRWRPIEA